MLTCLILAAGHSQRFGSPKALALLPNGKTVLEHIQETVLSTNVDDIIVILGAHVDLIQPHVFKHKHIRFVYNKYYNFGQMSSIKIGIQALHSSCDSFFILPVDYPVLETQTFNSIFENFAPEMLGVIPTFNNRKGHPPLLRSLLIPEILGISSNEGLNTVLNNNQPRIQLLEVLDMGVLETFNTFEEWLKITEKL